MATSMQEAWSRCLFAIAQRQAPMMAAMAEIESAAKKRPAFVQDIVNDLLNEAGRALARRTSRGDWEAGMALNHARRWATAEAVTPFGMPA